MRTRNGRHTSRQTTACTHCRKRKRRCDGKTPCEVCLSRGWTCEYAATPDQRKTAYKQGARRPTEAPTNSSMPARETNRRDWKDVFLDQNPQCLDFSLKVNDEGELEYRGPTSVVPSQPLVVSSGGARDTAGAILDPWTGCVPNSIDFPGPETISRHMDLFLKWQSAAIIILANAQVHEIRNGYDFAALQTKQQILLASILSLTHNLAGEEHLGEQYFRRAKYLLTQEMFSNHSIELVLAACILACRCYGCGMPNAAWTWNGISATTGNILGLHVGAEYEKWRTIGQMSRATVETRVQAYWASVVLDRMLATCLGRHCLIHPTDTNTPFASLIENAGQPTITQDSRTDHEMSTITTFQHSVTLWKLNDQALSEIYDFRHGMSRLSREGDESRILLDKLSALVTHFRAKVLEWHHKLPPSVRLSVLHPAPHRIMLELSYHNLLILIHRPFIVSCLCTSWQEGTDTPLLETASSICMTSALSIKDLVQLYWDHYGLRCPVFVMIHYIVNAATVFIAVSPSMLTDDQPRLESLRTCINALEAMSSTLHEAVNALRVIHSLLNSTDLHCRNCRSSVSVSRAEFIYPTPVMADDFAQPLQSEPPDPFIDNASDFYFPFLV